MLLSFVLHVLRCQAIVLEGKMDKRHKLPSTVACAEQLEIFHQLSPQCRSSKRSMLRLFLPGLTRNVGVTLAMSSCPVTIRPWDLTMILKAIGRTKRGGGRGWGQNQTIDSLRFRHCDR